MSLAPNTEVHWLCLEWFIFILDPGCHGPDWQAWNVGFILGYLPTSHLGVAATWLVLARFKGLMSDVEREWAWHQIQRYIDNCVRSGSCPSWVPCIRNVTANAQRPWFGASVNRRLIRMLAGGKNHRIQTEPARMSFLFFHRSFRKLFDYITHFVYITTFIMLPCFVIVLYEFSTI